MTRERQLPWSRAARTQQTTLRFGQLVRDGTDKGKTPDTEHR
jgi:hypothetical protein